MVEKLPLSQKEIGLFQNGKKVEISINGEEVVFYRGDSEGETYIKINTTHEDGVLSRDILETSSRLWSNPPTPPLVQGIERVDATDGQRVFIVKHKLRKRLNDFLNG